MISLTPLLSLKYQKAIKALRKSLLHQLVLLDHRVQHVNLLLLVLDYLHVSVASLLQLPVLRLELLDEQVFAAAIAGTAHLLPGDLLDLAALLPQLLLQRLQLGTVALVLLNQAHELLGLGALYDLDHVILALALNDHLLQLGL